jgi:predicted kinase
VKRVLVTMGIPGSGKSYCTSRVFGANPDTIIISPDQIRAEMLGDAADQSANAAVFERAHEMLHDALLAPTVKTIVFDATNIKRFARDRVRAIAEEYDAETTLLIFDTDWKTCCERNETRERTVPQSAMVRMRAEFAEALESVESEGWTEILRWWVL